MTEPQRIGTVWIDGRGAVVGRWDDEPVTEEIASGVPPKRRAVGSVRRGPARPFGGGRIGGTGTEGQHVEEMRRFFGSVAERVADLDMVEVSGRGPAHERFAALLRQLSEDGDGELEVVARPLARRPTPRQMAARLRALASEPLPRRTRGPFRAADAERDASGRVRPPGPEQFRNPRPRHLPERDEIELQLRMMLSDDEPAW
ncbi:MAG TPA: hypothetical protein VFL03_11040 [Candidatus Limnocylindrales bacterium]|jgi:hypothetical protein|nr:hypothetical protein [Candidatus Limnocylindrales bacterium]